MKKAKKTGEQTEEKPLEQSGKKYGISKRNKEVEESEKIRNMEEAMEQMASSASSGKGKSKSKKSDGGKELLFVPIGGCSDIGMNLYAYIYDDQWILVDMGMGFGKSLGQELIVPFAEDLVKNKSKIKALFITHSHEDHIGAIPYVWPNIECPIYARPFAAEMIRDKLSQFEFAKDVPLIRAAANKKLKVGEFTVEFIPVAHSTPESSALAISTPAGTVVHSGDWRIDDEPVLGSKTDRETLTKYGDEGVKALICDSTNVFCSEQSSSEKEVRENLIELVKKYKKNRIIVTCFASNLARLETCYYAAKASGRQVMVTGRSLKKIEKIAKLSGYFAKIPPFLDETKINSVDPSKVLLVCTGSQGEVNSALRKIADGTHRNIQAQEGDVMIFSSRIIPGNEKSVLDIQNSLIQKGVKIVMDIDHRIHASGHPSRSELELIYEWVRPKTLIPIHGEKIHLYHHAEIAKEFGIKNVVVVKDGDVVNLSKAKPDVSDEMSVQMLAVDGSCLVPLDSMVYKQREQLATCGVISMCIRCDKGYLEILAFKQVGVFEETEEMVAAIEKDILDEINFSVDCTGSKQKDVLKLTIKKTIKRVFLENFGKKPVVLLHMI